MGRYSKTQRLINSSDYYEFLRKKRDIRKTIQYATPRLHNPSVSERSMLLTETHIWTYGDRLYKLASKYYGDPRLWWIIGWYNGAPTEADLLPGDVIEIPINASEALKMLGA